MISDGMYECKILTPISWRSNSQYLEAGRTGETRLSHVEKKMYQTNAGIQFQFQTVTSEDPEHPYYYIQMKDASDNQRYLKYNSELKVIEWAPLSEQNDPFLFSLEPSETIENGYHLLIRSERDRILIGNPGYSYSNAQESLSVASVPTQLEENWEIVTIQLENVPESTDYTWIYILVGGIIVGLVLLYVIIKNELKPASKKQPNTQAQAQAQAQSNFNQHTDLRQIRLRNDLSNLPTLPAIGAHALRSNENRRLSKIF